MSLFGFDAFPIVEISPSLHFTFLIGFTVLTCSVFAGLLLIVSFGGESEGSRQPRGCRRLGLITTGHLADEYDDEKKIQGSSRENGQGTDHWRIKSLWIYPVKSCRGVELPCGSIVATGLKYDRLFSFAQPRATAAVNGSVSNGNASISGSEEQEASPRWRFIAQREYALMALIKTEIWVPDPTSPSYSPDAEEVQSGGVIIVRFPRPQDDSKQEPGWLEKLQSRFRLWNSNQEISFRIPFDPSDEMIKKRGYTTERFSIWKDSPLALNMSMHVPEELRRFLRLKQPVGLFRVGRGHEREVYRCAPRREELGWQPVTAFTDAFPIHLQNLASVRDLNRRMVDRLERLSVVRFRPNIISALFSLVHYLCVLALTYIISPRLLDF